MVGPRSWFILILGASKEYTMRLFQLFAFVLSMHVALAGAHAEPPVGDVATRDAPTRAARLSFMEGTVSYRAAGSDAWGDGTLNRPVTINDRIWADADSRAEIHLGSSAIRLSSRTQVTVTNLDESVLASERQRGIYWRAHP